MKFWDDDFTEKVYKLSEIIDQVNRHKKSLTFPTAVEYYGNYHR